MDYRLMKIIGWSMLGTGIGIMSVANDFTVNKIRKDLNDRVDEAQKGLNNA